MHLRDRGCLRTLHPLFVYASGVVWKCIFVVFLKIVASKWAQCHTQALIMKV